MRIMNEHKMMGGRAQDNGKRVTIFSMLFLSLPQISPFLPPSVMSQNASTPPSAPPARPRVMTVGTGISGLTLALLLEKVDIPKWFLSAVVKPLGRTLTTKHNVFQFCSARELTHSRSHSPFSALLILLVLLWRFRVCPRIKAYCSLSSAWHL